MEDTCLECGLPANWKRVTQFSGIHPYCTEHAQMEDDFGEENSYQFWVRVNEDDEFDF